MKFKINIELSFSKVMAFIILVMGFILSIILKDSSIIILAFTISGGIIGSKHINDQLKITKSK